MIATLCILRDVTKFTNSLPTFLQAAQLNWCDIPRVLNTLKDNLQAKIENLAYPLPHILRRFKNSSALLENPLVEDIS